MPSPSPSVHQSVQAETSKYEVYWEENGAEMNGVFSQESSDACTGNLSKGLQRRDLGLGMQAWGLR